MLVVGPGDNRRRGGNGDVPRGVADPPRSCALAVGDVEGATWAGHRPQRVSPYGGRLTRGLMVALLDAANPAGWETAMADICSEVWAEAERYDQVDPGTWRCTQKLRKTLV